MPSYNLGRAIGRIELQFNGAGAAQANAALNNVQSQGQAVSTGMLGIGAAIASGLAVGVDAAANFEQRLSAISAVSGATEADMEAVRSKALQLGKDTSFSAQEAASAMEELAKAGVSIPDIMNGAADATVALAAAGEVALPRAAEIASDAMNAFQLTAQDLPQVADIYAGAANASSVSIDQIAQSMSAVGAVANTVGLSLGDTTAAIGLLGNAGIKGSDAGTSLKTMLVNLQPSTEKQTALFKELGIVTEDGSNKFFDAQGNVRSMAEIAGVLGDSLEGMSKKQKLATLETLFGSDAVRAAAIIAEQGAGGVNKFSEAMGKVTAADVAAKRLDNFKGSLDAFKGSLETIAITVGSMFLPFLRQIIDALAQVANAFLGLSPATQSLIVSIAAAAAGLLLFYGAMIKMRALFLGLRAAMGALSLAAFGGPILIIVAAVAALGAAMLIAYRHSETFRNAFDSVINAFRTGEVNTGGFLGVLQNMASILGTVVLPAMLRLGAFLRAQLITGLQMLGAFIQGTIVPALIQFGVFLQTTVLPALQRFGAYIMGTVVPALLRFGQFLLANIVPALQVLGAFIVGTIIPGVARLAAAFGGALLSVFNGFRSALTAIIPAAASFIGAMIRLGAALAPVVGFVLKVVAVIVGGLIAAFLRVAPPVLRLVGIIAGVLIGALGRFIATILRVVAALITVVAAIIRFATTALSAIVRFGVGAIAAIGRFVSGAISAIGRFVSGAISGIGRAVSGMLSAMTSGMGRLVSAVASGAGRAVSAVSSGLSGMVGAVLGIGGRLFSAGAQIISQLVSGITSRIGAAVDAVKGAVSRIASFLPGSPVDEGPLRVLNRGYAGREIINMIADGIASQERALADVMGGAATRLAVAVPTGLGTALATRTATAAATAQPAASAPQPTGSAFPTHATLRVGQREFDAYVETINEDRQDEMARTLYAGRRG